MKNRWPPGPARRRSCSTKVRPRPTACRTPATASPGRSRTSSPATRPCGDSAASARPAGTPTGCRSRSRSARNWASTPRRRSRPTASNRSSTSASRAFSATCSSGKQLTERLGFWIHLDEAYVTFHQSYVESVWWALKNLFDRGLLYQGHKIVWWWAQGGTALSSGEVGQGYREVADPSVFVRFPLVDNLALGRGARAVLPCGEGPGVRAFRRRSARLDHHALDAAQQPVRRRQAGPRIFGRSLCGRAAKADHGLRHWWRRSPRRSARSSHVEATLSRCRSTHRPALYCRRFDYYYKTLGRGCKGRLKAGGRQTHCLARRGGRFRHDRHRHAASSTRPRPSARSTSTCCWPSKPASSKAKARS